MPASPALGWLLQGYRFERYRKRRTPATARLVLPEGVDGEELSLIADSVALARDLVNTPANDMGPAEIEAAIRALGRPNAARPSPASSATICSPATSR